MKSKVRTAEKKYSADRMMLNVAKSLVRDFQATFENPYFCEDFYSAIESRDPHGFRGVNPTPEADGGVPQFKAVYQLQSVFKRYRFRKDIYSDQELKDAAIASFMKTQDRIAALDLSSVDAQTEKVLELAAIYISQTLGVYDDETCRSYCRFGTRASVGVPSRKACEAARWELPISGSEGQISWFDAEMRNVECVQKYWAAQLESDPNRSLYTETESLTLTLVPKTFKSLRAIMPNSTIGSYMSFGIGEYMRKRLRRKGYDIRTLQERHRILASEASIHNLYTTADLSSASDSISVALVERLFPADWYDILSQSRIGVVTLPDDLQTKVRSKTFCTMGIGYTFPLQTLVFLALLKAIEATLFNRWNRRTISVYGDDMIYVSTMHTTVVRVFEQLGFVINLDKTFHEGHFRESCGGDYFHGVDVRPFQPQNGSAYVSKVAYEAMLYKYVNGLLARWSEHEISRTLRYLCTEIESVTGKAKLVPGDHPDDSGIKCPTLSHWSFLKCVEVAHPAFLGSGMYRFSYLRLMPDKREEVRHEPYLWDRLRGLNPVRHSFGGRFCPEAARSLVATVIDDVTGCGNEKAETFILMKSQPVETIRSKISGRRLRRLLTCVTVSNTGRYKRQSGISCFEIRR
jgi:hypothetical protein